MSPSATPTLDRIREKVLAGERLSFDDGMFLESPDRYSPVLAGMDVVRLAEAGQIVQGDREYGVLFDDDGKGPNTSRIYLFDSAESRNRFEGDPDVYLRPVLQAVRDVGTTVDRPPKNVSRPPEIYAQGGGTVKALEQEARGNLPLPLPA